MSGDLFAGHGFDSVYNIVQRDFPLHFGLHGVLKMAKMSKDESKTIATALDFYAKSMERAAKAAPDQAIAAAYDANAARVRSLQSKVSNLELEL